MRFTAFIIPIYTFVSGCGPLIEPPPDSPRAKAPVAEVSAVPASVHLGEQSSKIEPKNHNAKRKKSRVRFRSPLTRSPKHRYSPSLHSSNNSTVTSGPKLS